jgi:hypothetical protein
MFVIMFDFESKWRKRMGIREVWSPDTAGGAKEKRTISGSRQEVVSRRAETLSEQTTLDNALLFFPQGSATSLLWP